MEIDNTVGSGSNYFNDLIMLFLHIHLVIILH